MKSLKSILLFTFLFSLISRIVAQAPANAVNMDGVNDYIDPNILVTNYSNNFTIEMWARPTATHEIDVETNSSSNIDGVYNQRYILWPTWRNADGGLGISVGTNGVSVYEHGSNYMPPVLVWAGNVTAWTHIAVVVQSKQAKLYINGTLVKTGLQSTRTNVWPSLGFAGTFSGQVGGIGGGNYGYYAGDIDEFRIWTYPRTQAQIQATMNSELTCPVGLLAYYKFNQGVASSVNTTVTTAAEFSGNNYTGALVSMALTGTVSNWVASGASINSTVTTLFGASSSNSICTGQSATLTASGSSSYTWNPGTINATTTVVSPTTTTIYTLSGGTGSCSSTFTTLLTVVAPASIILVSAASPTICSGNTTTLSVTGSSSYTWLPVNTTGSSLPVSPASNTNYTVIGSSGSCGTSSLQVSVTVFSNVLVTASSTNICAGNITTLSVFNATNAVWIPGNVTGTSVVVSPSVSTVYSVNGTSCGSGTTILISVTAQPTLQTFPSSSLAVCQNSVVTLSVSGAGSYVWQPGSVSGSSISINASSSTVFSVTGTNGQNCTGLSTVTLSVNSNPTVSVGQNPLILCQGTSTLLTATGATSYTWLPGNINNSNLTVSPSVTTIYTVTGTNGNCYNANTLTVNVVNLPTLTISVPQTSLCAGNSIGLTGSGANSYTWLPVNINGNFLLATPATSTSYTLVGMNGNGCKNTQSISIQVFPVPVLSISVSSHSICSGNSSTVSAFGAQTYTWLPGNLSGSAQVLSPNVTTPYFIIGRNAQGCTSNTNVILNVVQTPSLSIYALTSSVCAGSSTTLSGVGANSYSWNPGSITTSSILVTPSVSTNYTLTGANGNCKSQKTFSVTIIPLPTLSVTAASTLVCEGNTVALGCSGANTYTWMPGGITQSNPTLTIYSNTNFTVTASGANGCKATANALINVAPLPIISVVATATNVCQGSSVLLNASGANNYTFQPGGQTNSIQSVLPVSNTVYTVTGTGTNNCVGSATIGIQVSSLPVINTLISSTLLCTGQTATITLNGANNFTCMPGNITGNTLQLSPTTTSNYTVIATNGACSGNTAFSLMVIDCQRIPFGVTNAVSKPDLLADSYRLTFTVTAVNASSLGMTDVSLVNNLKNTFSFPINYTVVSAPSIKSRNSNLIPNVLFDGAAQTDMLLPTASSLGPGKRDTVVYTIMVDPSGFSGMLKNSVLGSTKIFSSITLTDSSNTGFDYDPDNDGSPYNNNIPTEFNLENQNLFIPEAFSPDDDGKYDNFVIIGLNGRKAKLTIFNRWGNKVYENSAYDNSWNGVANAGGIIIGKGKVPPATYYLILEFSDGAKEMKTGFVEVQY